MYSKSVLPRQLQKQCSLIVKTGTVLGSNGVWSKGAENPANNIPFTGIILPLSKDDIKYDPSGTYTADDSKIYTSFSLINGQEIYDNLQNRWRVASSLSYQNIGVSLNIYYLKKVSVASND